MFGCDPFELVLLGVIAVMLYGKSLPEVSRTVGRTVGELRRQWTSLAREFDVAAHVDGRSPSSFAAGGPRPAGTVQDADAGLVAGPRFDPPEGEG